MVRNKDIKKALYRLRMDGKTPIEVINAIGKTMLKTSSTIVEYPKVNNVVDCDNKSFKRLSSSFKARFNINFPLNKSQLEATVSVAKKNGKLHALKFVKDLTKLGLRESKNTIDFMGDCGLI